MPSDSDSETVPAQVCPTCKRCFSNRKNLDKHVRNKGNKCSRKGNKDESVKCQTCQTVFSQPKALKKHRERKSCDTQKYSRVKKSESEVIHDNMLEDGTSGAVKEVIQPPAKNMIRMHLNTKQIMRELDMVDTETMLVSDPVMLTKIPSTAMRKDSQLLDRNRTGQADQDSQDSREEGQPAVGQAQDSMWGLVGRDRMEDSDLVSDPMRLTMVPGTVVVKDNQLVVKSRLGLVDREEDSALVDTVNILVSDPAQHSTVVRKDTQLLVTQPTKILTGCDAGYSSSGLDLVNREVEDMVDIVDMEVDPPRLPMVPSTVMRKDTQLVVIQPRKILTGCDAGYRVEDSDLVSDPVRLTMVPGTVVDNQLVVKSRWGLVDKEEDSALVDTVNILVSDQAQHSTVVRKDTQLSVTQPTKILTCFDAGYSNSGLDLVNREVEDMEDMVDMLDIEVDHPSVPMVTSKLVRKDTQLVVIQPRMILTGCDAGNSSSDLDLVNREVEDMEVEDMEGESQELPESHKLLLQFFKACETAVQMLTNRNEVITFLKIKRAIETITKRNFGINNLKQIQTVFQAAYTFSWERVLGRFGKKGNEFELHMSFNLDYKAENPNTAKFSPQDKVEREDMFYDSLKSIYRKLKDVAIPETDFPMVPLVEKVTTAAQILEQTRSLFEISPRARTNDDKIDTPKPAAKPCKELHGLPEKLVQKVLLKEAKKAEREMFHDKDREQKIKRLRRLPGLARMLKNTFTSENRAALPFDMVLEKVQFSYPGHLPTDVLNTDLRYLMEITKAWVENPSVQGVEYLKLDKTLDVNEVVEKLEKILEVEETPAVRGSGRSDAEGDQEPNSFFSSQVGKPLTSARKLEKKLSDDEVKELLEDYTPRYGTEVSSPVLI